MCVYLSRAFIFVENHLILVTSYGLYLLRDHNLVDSLGLLFCVLTRDETFHLHCIIPTGPGSQTVFFVFTPVTLTGVLVITLTNEPLHFTKLDRVVEGNWVNRSGSGTKVLLLHSGD